MKFRDVILNPHRDAPREMRPARSLFLLTNQWLPLLENLISLAQDAVGHPLSEILEVFPSEEEFGDVRLQRGLFELLFGYFFPIKSPVEDSRTLIERRKRLFEWIHAKGLMFTRRSERKEVLSRFITEELRLQPKSITEKEIDLLFFADHDKFLQVMPCEDEISPEVLRSKYNWEAFRALVRNSLRVRFTMAMAPIGSTVRKLYFVAKKYGLGVEFERLTDDEVLVQIAGPVQLVGRSTKYGNLLASFSWILFKEITVKHSSLVDIWVEAIVNDRKRWIHVDPVVLLSSISSLTEKSGEVAKETESGYDSSLEEAFYIQYRRCGAFAQLIHDAPVIIHDKKVIIPDGIFKYRGNYLYLEIMGYWTDTYARRKVNQINSLPQPERDRYIVLIDENINIDKLLAPHFRFSGKNFPWRLIREHLWNELEREAFDYHLSTLLQHLSDVEEKILSYLIENGGLAPHSAFQSLLKAESLEETRALLEKILDKSRLLREQVTYLAHSRGMVLASRRFIQQLKKELKESVFSKSTTAKIDEVNEFLNQKGISDDFFPLVHEILDLKKKYMSLTKVVLQMYEVSDMDGQKKKEEGGSLN